MALGSPLGCFILSVSRRFIPPPLYDEHLSHRASAPRHWQGGSCVPSRSNPSTAAMAGLAFPLCRISAGGVIARVSARTNPLWGIAIHPRACSWRPRLPGASGISGQSSRSRCRQCGRAGCWTGGRGYAGSRRGARTATVWTSRLIRNPVWGRVMII